MFNIFLWRTVNEANLEVFALKKSAKSFSCGSCPYDQCVFMLKIYIFSIAFGDAEDISIHGYQFSFIIFEDSIGNAIFLTYLSSLLNERFISKHSLVRNSDWHPSKSVLLHLSNRKNSFRLRLLVYCFFSLQFKQEIMNFWAKWSFDIFTN